MPRPILEYQKYFRCVVDISGSAVLVFLWKDEGARSAEAVNGGRHVKQTRGRLSLQLFLLRRLSPKKHIFKTSTNFKNII